MTAGLFGGAAGVLIPLGGLAAVDAIWTGLFGASAAFAVLRWGDYRRLLKQTTNDERRQIEAYGTAALSIEAQAVADQLASKFRRGRLGAQYRRSAAGDGFRRLQDAAAALDVLEPRLPPHAQETLADARGSATKLKDLAERIRGVERTMEVTSSNRSQSLTELHSRLVNQFNDGIDAYEHLVTVCAELMGEHTVMTSQTGMGEDELLVRLDEATTKLRAYSDAIVELRTTN